MQVRASDRIEVPLVTVGSVLGGIVVALCLSYVAVATRLWDVNMVWAAMSGVSAGAVGVVLLAWQAWTRRQRRKRQQVQAVADRLAGIPAPSQSWTTVERRSVWDAIHEALLPRSFHPTSPDPAEARSCIRLDINARLCFADRLRLLLTGDLRVLATVYTDVEVKHADTLANIEIHPFTLEE